MYIKISFCLIMFFIFPISLSGEESSFSNIKSLIEKNSLERATLEIENLNADNKQKSKFYFIIGEKYFLLKNFKKSLLCFEKAEGYENLKTLNWNKGLCFFGMKRYDKSFDCFLKSINNNSSEEEILLAANSGYLSENYTKALKILEEKQFLDKKEEMLNLKSQILFSLKNYEKCLDVHKKLLKIKPYDKLYFNNYIKLKKILKKDIKSDLYIQKVLEKDFEFLFDFNQGNKFLKVFYHKKLSPQNHYETARLYYDSGLYIKAFKAIEKIKTSDFKSDLLKAKILFINGEYKNSGELFLSLAELNKEKSGELYYFAGEAYLMVGEYVKAFKCFSLSQDKKSIYSDQALNIISGEI
ncbi:MAG: hypothetical protein RBR53_02260 [Desulforegulaceae bacterium]|nr:hypothetical protein [Desulforegulaceae bacterium]